MPAKTTRQGNNSDISSIYNQGLPQLAATVEQNVKPVMTEAQHIAAKTSFSGRRAVSRGTMFLAFYLWLLSGAAMLSWIAQRTDFFPGDMSITHTLQKQKNPWFRRYMLGVSQIGFLELSIPFTLG